MNINSQQWLSVARWVVSFGGGFFVGKGYITAEQLSSVTSNLPTIISGVAAVATLIWGVTNKTDRSLVVQAAAVPGVKAVVVDTAVAPAAVADTAKAANQPKVVSG